MHTCVHVYVIPSQAYCHRARASVPVSSSQNNAHINAVGYKLVGIWLDEPGATHIHKRKASTSAHIRVSRVPASLSLPSPLLSQSRTRNTEHMCTYKRDKQDNETCTRSTCFLATSALDLSNTVATPRSRARNHLLLRSINETETVDLTGAKRARHKIRDK